MNFSNQPVLALYAFCCAILVIILYALGFWTAKTRAERKVVVNPEDVSVNRGAKVLDSEHPDVHRVKRTHLNALENFVPFFVLGLLYSMTDPNLTLARVLFSTFVVIRIAHAFFYVNAKQPFRTGSFAVGAIINLVMVVQVMRAVLPTLFG